MKKVKLNLFVLVVVTNAFVFTACDKEKDRLSATPTQLDFLADDIFAQQVIVNTNVKGWNATPSSNWIIVVKDDGKFTVAVSKYDDTTAPREGKITVSAAGKEVEVIVRQSAAVVTTLQVNPTSLRFATSEITAKSVSVVSNVTNWTFSNPPAWLTLTKEGTATLKLSPTGYNFGAAPRTTTVTITAGNAAPVQIEVTQDVTDISGTVFEFDRADAYYWGDYHEFGSGNFDIHFCDALNPDPNYGLWIEMFSSLQPGGENLKLDEGTYTYDELSGEPNTFSAGYFGTVDGTQVEITGGSFTVTLSGDTYTIEADFSGKDINSGSVISNLNFEFSGTLFFDDLTPYPTVEFTDITSGVFTASGIPNFFDPPGPESWNGEYFSADDEYGQYYAFEPFEDVDLMYFCNFEDGRIYVDGAEIIGGTMNGQYNAYFRGCLFDGEDIFILNENEQYPVRYHKATGILDFSLYFVDNDGVRIEGWLGIVALPASGSGSPGLFSDLYANLKYQLTPTSPTSYSAGKSASKLNQRLESKRLARDTKNTIKVDKSKMIKVPKSDLKLIDAKTMQPSGKKLQRTPPK